MTRYRTKVSDELIPLIRAGDLPAGLRLVAEIELIDGNTTLVEFEDDNAPASYEGKLVTPVISSSWGRTYQDGQVRPDRSWISERILEDE